MHEGRIPGGRHADHLWKLRRVAGKGDAMQPFVPPIVLRNAQSRDGRRMVAHLLHLLFERQPSNQIVDAPVNRNCRVHKR